MRAINVLGLIGAAGLWGLSSAQEIGNSPVTVEIVGNSNGGSGSGAVSGLVSSQQTCPFAQTTTVFVTSTVPSVFTTVSSTVTIGVSPGSGNPGYGGSAAGSSGPTHYPSGPDPISWSPAGVSVTNSGPWSTDFLTLTLPPTAGQTTPSIVTYTIVSPEASNSHSTNSASHPQTLTVTSSGISTGTPTTPPHTLTITVPGNPSSSGGHSPEGSWAPFSGGSESSRPLPTITVTLPVGLSTGLNGGTSGSQPLQTFTVTIPSVESDSEPQTLTITAPNGSPTVSNADAGGIQPPQTYTVTIPSEDGNQPQTLTVMVSGGSPTDANVGTQTLPTLTVTVPSGETGGQPQTLTITAPNGSPTPSGENQPLQTFTVTIPSGEIGPEPQTLTVTAPIGSPTIPNGPPTAPYGGNQPLQTFTVTIPSGEIGPEPQTLTVTAPIGSPTSSSGGTSESQPIQTITVTAPNGLSTFTFTVPEQSLSSYTSGSSLGGGGQPPSTVTIPTPTESASGNGGRPGVGQPLETITFTIPEGGLGSNQPPQTLTLTIPSESFSSSAGAGSEQTPLPTYTITLPASPNESGGQNGPITITLTAPGGLPNISSGPGSQSTSSCDESGSGIPTGGPWTPLPTAGIPSGQEGQPGVPSSEPCPESGSTEGPIASTSPCTETSSGASGASNTGGLPFPVITLTLSEDPFVPGPGSASSVLPGPSPPMSAGSGSSAETNPGGGYGVPAVSETTILPPQESAPCTTFASSSSAAQGAGEPGYPSPAPPSLSRGPFSSLPSSGWNFSTSASQEGPVSQSTTPPAAGPNPSETTCTDSAVQSGASIPTPLPPSFPPPVSPAFTPPGEGPIVTSPSESVIASAGSEAPDGCLSMTTMVLSTMTFSWCGQMAFPTPRASATGPTSLQSGGSLATNALSPMPNSGEYEFPSSSKDKRSPLGDVLHRTTHIPSTLATVVIPSRLREDILAPSETPFCGGSEDMGNFTLDFDDFPPSIGGNKPKPISRYTPYHRFYYTGGFAVIPPHSVPFRPSSGDFMVQFTPSSISNTGEDGMPPDTANIGVGPQKVATCFSFNFNGVNVGCDSKKAPCSFTFTGFRYDASAAESVEVISQNVMIPVCPDTENCPLTPVTVSNFDDLTSITIKAEVDGEPIIWWLDDFTLGWFDNACDLGICRSQRPNGIQKQDWTANGRQVASKLMSLIGVRG